MVPAPGRRTQREVVKRTEHESTCCFAGCRVVTFCRLAADWLDTPWSCGAKFLILVLVGVGHRFQAAAKKDCFAGAGLLSIQAGCSLVD